MITQELFSHVLKETSKIIKGQNQVIEQLFVTYCASGHILLESVPGLAKTLLSKTFARVTGLTFKRIQFTPDLMPSDITGTSVFNLAKQEFEFRKGPVFTNILLADEINRASPKTQSALLEVMQEFQVTADGTEYTLERPYMVIATQNPLEFEGTYPLPEAQLDRFFMKILLEYPAYDDEIAILNMVKNGFDSNSSENISIVPISNEMFQNAIKEIASVTVDERILTYIADIAKHSRLEKDLILGLSTRAAVTILTASRIVAAMDGRDYVLPDDVKKYIVPLLRHRVILNSEAEINGLTTDAVIEKIVQMVKVPR